MAEVRSDCVRVFGQISALRDLDESTDSPAISRLDLGPNPSHSSAKDFCHGLLGARLRDSALMLSDPPQRQVIDRLGRGHRPVHMAIYPHKEGGLAYAWIWRRN